MLRSHLTFSNVISLVALVFALGGTSAYAANTVLSADIVDGEVKTVDLGPAAVTNGKLADNSIGSGKIVNGAVTSDKVANDALTGADINESTLDLPAASGGIASNRIVTQAGTSGQSVIAVPGLGEVRSSGCSVKSAGTKFVNNTLAYVDVVSDLVMATAPTPPKHDLLGPNEETTAGLEGTQRAIYQVGLGQPGKVATVVVTAWPTGTNCRYQAMLLTK
jgi:hypothetical protein